MERTGAVLVPPFDDERIVAGQATAALTGIGTTAAAVVLTPTTLSFPSTNVGATSSPQTITISNTGATATTLQTPAVAGDFSILTSTCGPSLGPTARWVDWRMRSGPCLLARGVA